MSKNPSKSPGLARGIACCLALCAAVVYIGASAAVQSSPAAADGDAKPRVSVKTSMGDFVLELEPDKAPMTVSNFLRYVRDGFYDNTYVDTIVQDYRIEAGGWHAKEIFEKKPDPLAPPPDKDVVAKELKARPYPMEEIAQGLHAPVPNESGAGLSNVSGTIAMNRLVDADSATSRFFINVNNNSFLDAPNEERGGKGMTVFGRVVEGMDVVERIQRAPAIMHADHPVGQVTPAEKIVIESMRLTNGYDSSEIDAKLAGRLAAKASKADQAQKQSGIRESQLNAVIKGIEAEAGKPMIKTASGLRYAILREGSGTRHPKASNKVKVHYWGQRVDGFEFDNSYKRGTPNVFNVNSLVQGWSEGLKYMTEGAKAKFVIPPELGYGSTGSGEDLPPNSWLVFQVELIEIVDN